MPHYKCDACRVRLQAAQSPSGVLCPQCGSALDPVVDVTELLGLRRIVLIGEPGSDANDVADHFEDPPVAAAMALTAPSRRPDGV